jgi:hypothetical protein
MEYKLTDAASLLIGISKAAFSKLPLNSNLSRLWGIVGLNHALDR